MAQVYVEPRLRRTIRKTMRRFGWHRSAHDDWITGRLYSLTIRRRPWWDWGHRVMILVGSSHGGNYDNPTPPTWWYRQGPATIMWRTGYPRHPLRTFQIIKGDYGAFRSEYEGLGPDDQYAWKAIHINQDGELSLGRRYWGEAFYGLDRWETAILRRYLWAWRWRNWFGLRSWLYTQALHAAVHQRKPFACQATPPPGTGGYSHWHCQLPKSHTKRGEMHRSKNYTWGEIDGEALPTTFHPTKVKR